ncbi:MAG TPA: hypothetical protein VGN35_11780 [Jatrophihabitantaceae bacterium]|jgi:hypothetical protein|nr:hypothetical protein [Jatrophihabitantaceae bacterium]
MTMVTANPANPATTTAAAAKAPAKKPGAARRFANSAAALRDQRTKMIQLGLFAAGAVLMPLGLLSIGLGWYGTAHAHYDYDQRTYLISGGILGLGLTFVGGFLYFGAWLARMVSDQHDSQRQLTESLNTIAGLLSQQATSAGVGPEAGADELVFAGDGTTIHRRSCPLITSRTDLHLVTGRETGTTNCRVCRPSSI